MEDIMNVMRIRHSVRSYQERPLEPETAGKLNTLIDEINRDGALSCRLVCNDTSIFDTFLNHYGWFKKVNNVIILAGKGAEDLEERAGYYGEKLVLEAQQMGLGTCWVGGTYNRKKVLLQDDEKLVCVIAVGYPEKFGSAHHSKWPEQVSNISSESPDWFKKGVEAALLAPTAVNQQKFRFILDGTKVKAEVIKNGPFVHVDLGIAKYHFEQGAGSSNFQWT